MARRPKTDDFTFEGFESPTTTPVPDVVFDRLLARLGEAELKALLYIIRRTFGFKKDRDPISFNQFLRGITTQDGRTLDEGCGVRDRTTLSKALKSLESKGIVLSEKGTDERGENVTTVYRLRFKDPIAGSNTAAEIPAGVVGNSHHPMRVVGDPYHPGMNSRPRVVRNSYPQQTVKQQTGRHNSNVRNATHVNLSGVAKSDRAGEQATSSPAPVRPSSSQTTPADPPPRPRLVKPERLSRDREGQPVSVAESLKRRRSRSAASVEDREILVAYLADFARELNDQAPLRVSVTRALNLLSRSGLPRQAFLDKLYQARSLTKEHSASITTTVKREGAPMPVKAKMAYFFAVLEDLLGFKDELPPAPN
jgi:hypothetical protein